MLVKGKILFLIPHSKIIAGARGQDFIKEITSIYNHPLKAAVPQSQLPEFQLPAISVVVTKFNGGSYLQDQKRVLAFSLEDLQNRFKLLISTLVEGFTKECLNLTYHKGLIGIFAGYDPANVPDIGEAVEYDEPYIRRKKEKKAEAFMQKEELERLIKATESYSIKDTLRPSSEDFKDFVTRIKELNKEILVATLANIKEFFVNKIKEIHLERDNIKVIAKAIQKIIHNVSDRKEGDQKPDSSEVLKACTELLYMLEIFKIQQANGRSSFLTHLAFFGRYVKGIEEAFDDTVLQLKDLSGGCSKLNLLTQLPTKANTAAGGITVISAPLVKISEIIDMVGGSQSIRIIAAVVYFDQDIVWHSKNLSIVAPRIYKTESKANILVDLEGRQGVANAESKDKPDAKDGGHGGKFVLRCNMEKQAVSWLRVEINGGNGCDGYLGTDGFPGLDGKLVAEERYDCLSDDHLQTICYALREGRAIYQNKAPRAVLAAAGAEKEADERIPNYIKEYITQAAKQAVKTPAHIRDYIVGVTPDEFYKLAAIEQVYREEHYDLVCRFQIDTLKTIISSPDVNISTRGITLELLTNPPSSEVQAAKWGMAFYIMKQKLSKKQLESIKGEDGGDGTDGGAAGDGGLGGKYTLFSKGKEVKQDPSIDGNVGEGGDGGKGGDAGASGKIEYLFLAPKATKNCFTGFFMLIAEYLRSDYQDKCILYKSLIAYDDLPLLEKATIGIGLGKPGTPGNKGANGKKAELRSDQPENFDAEQAGGLEAFNAYYASDLNSTALSADYSNALIGIIGDDNLFTHF